jgi:hypothetical protein
MVISSERSDWQSLAASSRLAGSPSATAASTASASSGGFGPKRLVPWSRAWSRTWSRCSSVRLDTGSAPERSGTCSSVQPAAGSTSEFENRRGCKTPRSSNLLSSSALNPVCARRQTRDPAVTLPLKHSSGARAVRCPPRRSARPWARPHPAPISGAGGGARPRGIFAQLEVPHATHPTARSDAGARRPVMLLAVRTLP